MRRQLDGARTWARHAAWGLAVATGALLVVAAAGAHHSFAPHFDASKRVSISGIVTQYERRNPHSYLHLSAEDENGRTRQYVCESHGVTQLTRNGITPEMLTAGTKVRVAGAQSRHSPYMCFFDTIEFEDGRTLSINGPAGAPGAAPGAASRRDLFGVWLLTPNPNRTTSGSQPMMEFLTPAGEAAVAVYDPFRDDPTFRCDPVGIRRVWAAPGTPLEIVREGSQVVLRHEWMDVRRVIHMGVTTHPTDVPRATLGHSIGRFDGDTLVIETAHYPRGVLNQYVEQSGQPTRGLLHSAALRTVERVRFDAARQRLVVEIDMVDPEYFTRPFPSFVLEYAPSDLRIEPFDCSPEGLTGTIRQ